MNKIQTNLWLNDIFTGLRISLGIALGLGMTGLLAVAVSGTFNTFTSGAVIKSSEVNTNFATLKTAVEGITSSQWTTSGANIGYTAGNVGIGTTSPVRALHVENVNAEFVMQDSDYVGSGKAWRLGINNTDGFLYLQSFTSLFSGAVQILTANPNGNIGLGGNVAPAFKLDVTGDINATGCVKGSAGTVTGGGTCTSDRNLKKNIQYYTDSLDKITQLKPASFEWKKDQYDWLKPYADKDNGLIAQDVEKVFPHLVKTDARGFKTISYSIEMEMHLIQSIKELAVRVRDLHDKNISEISKQKVEDEKTLSRLRELQSENAKLREELTTIRQRVATHWSEVDERLSAVENTHFAKK